MAENSKDRIGNQEGGNRSTSKGKQTDGTQGKKGTSNRGFASMNPEQQREIARKGGAAVSVNREHMSQIGKKGGEASGGGKGRASQQKNF